MTQEALKLALEALKNYAWHGEACPQHPTYSKPENYPKCTCGYDKAITAIKEALADHAMRETQRLGQEIEQEPVAHWSDCAVHSGPAYPAGGCDCGAQQGPVAYIRVSKTGNVMACAKTGDFYKLPDKTLLYTTPLQRKPLTPEQIAELDCLDHFKFARAIEVAHGIKENT